LPTRAERISVASRLFLPRKVGGVVYRRVAVLLGCGGVSLALAGQARAQAAERRGTMPTKLDPILAAMLDDPLHEADREVVLMVGLSAAATDAVLADLRGRGLTVRSTIGDILTGAAPLGRVAAIADHPAVVKIEAATPLAPEAPLPGG